MDTNINKTKKYEEKNNQFFEPTEAFVLGNIDKNIYRPDKNLKPFLPQVENQKDSFLLEIMILYSYIHDLNLYLDVYPNNKEALELFTKYNQIYKEKEDEFEKKFGLFEVQNSDNVNGTFEWVLQNSTFINGDKYYV